MNTVSSDIDVLLTALAVARQSIWYGGLQMIFSEIQNKAYINRSVLDYSINAIALAGLDGKLTYVNRSFYRMWKIPSDESLVGRNVEDFWETGQDIAYITEQITAEDEWSGELTAQRSDGTKFAASVSAYAIKDESGRPVQLASSFIDISRQKTFEERNTMLVHAVEQSPSAIVITDNQGRIEYVNPAFALLTGYSVQEVLGKKPSILKSGHTDTADYSALWDEVLSGRIWKGEFLNRKKNGELYWEQASISAVTDSAGRKNHFIKVAEDITKKRELESIQEKIDTVIAHDLRNPITSITAIPKLLLEEENLTSEQKQYIEMIEDSGFTVLNLLNNLMNLKKIEYGVSLLEKSTIDLIPLIKHIFQKKQIKETDKNTAILIRNDETVSWDDSFLIRGNESLLVTVLSNLIDNAVEASPEGSPITFIFSDRKDEITFAVHNLGTVPEKIRHIFFNKFVTTKKGRGTGLGTYSCKLMVEAMGGTISMQTSEKTGTKITINLAKNGSLHHQRQ